MKEIGRNLYEIENKKNLPNCFIELEESLFKLSISIMVMMILNSKQ